MIDVKKILGENIKNRRKSLNITQEELSNKLDISPKHLSNIESGQKFVSAALLESIKKELDIPFSDLFFDGTDLPETVKKVQKLVTDETATFVKSLNEKLNKI